MASKKKVPPAWKLALEEPGVGKTKLFKKAAKKLGLKVKKLKAGKVQPGDLAGIPVRVPRIDTEVYRKAVSGESEPRFFTVANDWVDKPHRLVYDLCNEIDRLRLTYESDFEAHRPDCLGCKVCSSHEYKEWEKS